MKRVSSWASINVLRARFLIIIITLVLGALAYYAGITLYHMQIILPATGIYWFAFAALCVAIALYPEKKKRFPKGSNYLRQKSCDLVLACCSFLIVCTGINNGDTMKPWPGAYGSITVKTPRPAEDILKSINSGNKTSLTHKEKKILKHEFFRQLKVFATAKAAGDGQKAGEAWKIVLVIIAALGLLFLLTALVCTLACNGSGFAAAAVMVLGLAAVIWGTVVVIKRINRGPKK